MIDQYLERSGEEKYLLAKDEFQSTGKILKFAWKVFSESSDISLSFGAPMDVMGNMIDSDGNSIDERGNPIDIIEYFSGESGVEKNKQRESVYTRHLGKQIIDSFKEYNVVLSSHIVAFAAFELLKKLNSDLDIFGLISVPADDFIFDQDLLLDIITQLQAHIVEMADSGEIRCSLNVKDLDPEQLLKRGLAYLGSYHVEQPLMTNKRGAIVSQSLKLLFFYHNRLENYEFEKVITWDESKLERALETTDL